MIFRPGGIALNFIKVTRFFHRQKKKTPCEAARKHKDNTGQLSLSRYFYNAKHPKSELNELSSKDDKKASPFLCAFLLRRSQVKFLTVKKILSPDKKI
jgi:hypothetical protein